MWPGHVTCTCDSHVTWSCNTASSCDKLLFDWFIPYFTRKTSRHRNCADVLISHWPAGNRTSSLLMFWILKNFSRISTFSSKINLFHEKSLNETLWKILWVTQTEQSGRQDSNSSRIKVHPYATIHILFRSSYFSNRKNSVQLENGRSWS